MKGGEEAKDTQDELASLRRGWTTGTCAAAAARAAYEALLTGECPSSVAVTMPGGTRPSFSVASCERVGNTATAGIIKDAGDDPDVTHGALIKATVSWAPAGSGVTFRAGDGVGTVTRPGLPIPPGEPAINPVPRKMIAQAIAEAAQRHSGTTDVVVEVSVPGGEEMAKKTLNGRLGIVGGLSILGTTGVVIPFSCAAWIDTIHRGIDVARAMGLKHIAGSTGTTSETAVQTLYQLPDAALIEMGDFVGGMLKYLKRHPVDRVTIAGGFAKMTKLGQGMLDLHSKRGEVDFVWLADLMDRVGAPSDVREQVLNANTAQLVLQEAVSRGLPLGDLVAKAAWAVAANSLGGADIILDVVIFDRQGKLAGRTEMRPVHAGLPR